MRARAMLWAVPPLLAGCILGRNAEPEERETVLITDEQAVALERRAAPAIIQRSGGRVRDPALAAYVDGVGRAVASRIRRAGVACRFAVLDSADVGSLALPGGGVFVTRGALLRLPDEDSLACLLGREAGHVEMRHGLRRIQTTLGIQAVLRLARFAPDPPSAQSREEDAGSLAALIGLLGEPRYDRGESLESDRLGIRYAAGAGYDPGGMPDLPGFDGDDPVVVDRLRAARAVIARLQVPEGGWPARREEPLRQALARLREREPHAAAVEAAVASHAAACGGGPPDLCGGRLSIDAVRMWIDAIDAALAACPDEARFHAARGWCLWTAGAVDAAREGFDRGRALDPGSFPCAFGAGVARAPADIPSCREAFDTAERLWPTHPGPAYHVGMLHLAAGRSDEAAAALERSRALDGPDGPYAPLAESALRRLGG